MATNIPYVDETLNFMTGCTKCSPGCLNCFAEELHNTRHKAYLAGKKLPKQYAKPFSEIQLFPDRLEIPLHWRKPRKILTCSMGDLFHEKVPFEFIAEVYKTAAFTEWHTYLFLTKRIDRALEFFKWLENKHTYDGGALMFRGEKTKWQYKPWPLPNVHLGVTICNPDELWKVMVLTGIPAAYRWLSIEPLLADIVGGRSKPFMPFPCDIERPIDFVVIGCESGPNRRPCKREWIKSLVQQCKAAGVNYMVKQMAENEDGTGKVCHDIEKIKAELGEMI